MYSLRTQEKRDAERDQNSSREILWRNLSDKKKSGRMVRRIYNKTREEMVQSCRSRCGKWAIEATSDMGRWVREPQPSVFQHTFRDRQPGAELGPANGHVSGRKYIPRLVFTGGGELNEARTADLLKALSIPSKMRGNDPNALQNPCRPTVTVTDTAKIRGRVEHPHWEPPRYFLRPREKAKEIGPDIQYADRNDMQRIFSGVVKNSLFAWGPYEGGGAWAAPSCRIEKPEKWMGDEPFYPGFRYGDTQRETMAGAKYSSDLLNCGDYARRSGFARERHPNKEHGRFRLVVRDGEYACPQGKTRRSLRFEAEPPQHYPEEKMYFASLRSLPLTTAAGDPPGACPARARLRASSSLGSLGFGSPAGVKEDGKADVTQRGGESVLLPLSASESSPVVRFSPEHAKAAGEDRGEGGGQGAEGGGLVEGQGGGEERISAGASAETHGDSCDMKIAGGMRRGSEVASWVICGERDKSARDYLW